MANPASTAVMGDVGEVEVGSQAIARLTQWSFNPTANLSEWGDSDSQGYTNVRPARKAGTGSIEGKMDSGDEFYDLFSEGDEPELTLWATTALYWNIPCGVISGYTVTIDTDSKEVVGWSADFSASGIFYYPGHASAPSKTYPT